MHSFIAGLVCRSALATMLGLAASSAVAQGAADLQGQALQWLQSAVRESGMARDGALRMEVSVGELDARLKLAPCGNLEFYQPPGARLWGRTRVGVRCVDGMARWNVSVPATVRATGLAWVLRNPVSVGAPISDKDVVQAEVDWAAESDPILDQRSQWLDQIASRSLVAGQPLRRTMVKPAQVFQPGAVVRVVAQGAGFQVSAEGQALTAGVVGQNARVRMDNGRVSSGVVVDTRTVRIDL
ncbi:flagellar basal body P-ring formation chaperone FlgA [Curvibacter sp. APW13]|uniref:flagellar basal body P-ring formation chaperone FlgA n=1 Tax=Curvibacter sp. APW13 TaxID=3077236 RepID=UPI0028DF1053|nr:flagellar basal body P-ring formation chaperone FlgA [Curvibacter sp. APW13]MDT8993038.1 flagellar basal body P-ring formation chaperone FlgA [Curvibacter sp. APW13]